MCIKEGNILKKLGIDVVASHVWKFQLYPLQGEALHRGMLPEAWSAKDKVFFVELLREKTRCDEKSCRQMPRACYWSTDFCQSRLALKYPNDGSASQKYA